MESEMKELYEAILAKVTTIEECLTGIEDLYRTQNNTTYNIALQNLDRYVYDVQDQVQELRETLEYRLSK